MRPVSTKCAQCNVDLCAVGPGIFLPLRQFCHGLHAVWHAIRQIMLGARPIQRRSIHSESEVITLATVISSVFFSCSLIAGCAVYLTCCHHFQCLEAQKVAIFVFAVSILPGLQTEESLVLLVF